MEENLYLLRGKCPTKKNYLYYNSFNLLVKHLYNLGIYDIHSIANFNNKFHFKDHVDNLYNIDENVYNYQYWKDNDKMELENLLNTKYKNKSFDIIKNILSDSYTIAFKTFPY